MKLTAWLILFLLTVFMVKIAMQNEQSATERSVAAEKSQRITIR